MHVYTCTCMYIRVIVHTYMYDIYTCTCMYLYVRVIVYTCTCMYMYMYIQCKFVNDYLI